MYNADFFGHESGLRAELGNAPAETTSARRAIRFGPDLRAHSGRAPANTWGPQAPFKPKFPPFAAIPTR